MLRFTPEIIKLYTDAGYAVAEVAALAACVENPENLEIVKAVGKMAPKLREILLRRHSMLPVELQEALVRYVIDRIAIEASSISVLDATFQNLDLFGQANFTGHQIAEIAIKSESAANVRQFAAQAKQVVEQKNDIARKIDDLSPSARISWAEIIAHRDGVRAVI